MATMTVPLSASQLKFINSMVKSGKAANKAHAVRLALDYYAREEALETIRLGMREVHENKTLRGDLNKLAELID